MAFTFDPTLPTAVDRLRRALGDTTAPGLRTNEEVAATLARYPDEALALAVLAEGLAVEFAQKPDSISDEGTTVTWRDRVKTWLAIASGARTLAALASATTGGMASSVATTRAYDEQPSQYARPLGWWPI